jgi:hypothetical protein
VPRQPLENSLNPDHPLPGTSCCNSALTWSLAHAHFPRRTRAHYIVLLCIV